MFSTRSGFFHIVHKEMLLRTLISSDATLCTASASYTYALGPPQGPRYLLLGHTLSILVSTNSDVERDQMQAKMHLYAHIFAYIQAFNNK